MSTGRAQQRSAAQGGSVPDGSSTERTADLLARVRAGEAAAWDLLVQRLSGLLWSVARAHRLSEAECADVVQNTWLRLLEHLDSVREPDRLPGWLATTARRESLRSLRTAERLSSLDQEGAYDRPDDTLEPLDASLLRDERDAQLWQAFAQLPPGCQALLRLLLADPAPSYEDVAAALDRPVGAIGPTRGRCLRRLRAVLERTTVETAARGGSGEERS